MAETKKANAATKTASKATAKTTKTTAKKTDAKKAPSKVAEKAKEVAKEAKEVASEKKEKKTAAKEAIKEKTVGKIAKTAQIKKSTRKDASAVAKYVRMSPIKLRPITDLVRGKDLNEALTILKFTPGKGAELVEKVVQSAAANAENNFDLELDNLYVAEICADQGPTMKRWRAGAQGRASMILKRSSHISVTLKEKE